MSLLLDSLKEMSNRGRSVIDPDMFDNPPEDIQDIPDEVSNIKKANKQISQLIAEAWLKDDPDIVNQNAIAQRLIDNNLIDDANEIEVIIDTEPYNVELWKKWNSDEPPATPPATHYKGYIRFDENPTKARVYTPFPQRPSPEQVTDEQLENWIAQQPDEEPLVPDDVWIPATC